MVVFETGRERQIKRWFKNCQFEGSIVWRLEQRRVAFDADEPFRVVSVWSSRMGIQCD